MLRNALWQLLHARNLEDGLIDTVRRGGDTDTNAAICGALLGAVHGRDYGPERWIDQLLVCRRGKNGLGCTDLDRRVTGPSMHSSWQND